MKYLAAAVITVILLVACCEKESAEAAGVHPSDSWVYLGKGNDIRQYTFPDGTRCVVLDGASREQLACDWSYARPMKVER